MDFCEYGEYGVEVGTSELPFEGLGDLLVMVLEVEQPGFRLDEVAKVVWGKDLALHDGEVDLDLVEPGSMSRKVDEDQLGPSSLQSRSMEAWPRWLLPLSTIQNTRSAEA